MKKKEWQQLKNKPLAELQKKLEGEQDRLWQLRTDLASGKVKNVREIRLAKKTIAQLLTVINQLSQTK